MSKKDKSNDHYIRGDKTRFSKRERSRLHDFPSAQAHEPLIVHSHPRRGLAHNCARFFAIFALLATIVLAAVVYVIESGSLDRYLSKQANETIAAAMPAGYKARVASTRLRLGSGLRLELQVGDVEVLGPQDTQLASVGQMDFSLDTMRLATGQISIKAVSADEIEFDSSALPSTGVFRLTDHRVDSLPLLVEQVFDHTDFARGILEAAQTRTIELRDIAFPVGSASADKTVTVDIRSATFSLLSDGILRADGQVALDGIVSSFSAEAAGEAGRTTSLQAEVKNLVMTPFLMDINAEGNPVVGMEGTADLSVSLKRAEQTGQPEVYAEINVDDGRFVADSIARSFKDARVNLTYDNTKKTIELSDSSIDFDGSYFPFNGGIIDLDQIKTNATEGYGLDFLVHGGRFKSREPGLPPLVFDAKFTGEYHASNTRLLLDNITVSSPQGIMAGSFKATFGDKSPELSFGGRIEHMDTEAVKQLWPFWIARKPREWVTNNLHGGQVTNGDIAVFIPEGRMQGHGVPIELNENELKIGFDINNTRITLNNTFPDVEDSSARVTIDGGKVNVAIGAGKLSVAKGRSVALDSGSFQIASTYQRPLMGAVDVNLTGATQDLVALAAAPPVNALKSTDFAVSDFSGTAKTNIKASVWLDEGPSEVPSDWSVTAELNNVGIAKPINGFTVQELSGAMNIVPSRLLFSGSGTVNDVPLNLEWELPLDKSADKADKLLISGTLSNSQRDALVPGLSPYVNGPIGLTIDRTGNENAFTVDLKSAVLQLPWIYWSKPAGVPLKLTFTNTDKDGLTILDNLVLSGSDIGARGRVEIDSNGLLSATLSNVSLSPGDDFNVAAERTATGLDVAVTGKSISLEDMLKRQMNGGASQKKKKKGSSNSGDNANVSLNLVRLIGMNKRSLTMAQGELTVKNGEISTANFSATTASGQPVTLDVAPDSGSTAIHLKTSGAGALLRFAGLYQKMTSGQLNADFIETATGWHGMVHINDFRVVDDEQVKVLLSTPSGQNGQSLNARFSNKINQTDQRFQRAQAVLDLSDGVLRVSDAFVRGDQLGATMKGVVRDADGNIDLTGTFMPAYGLNRIFAEIPLIGPILGNGQDKGLFGITFKLVGKAEKPELVLNPLSAIAPGVFRRIFEFQ